MALQCSIPLAGTSIVLTYWRIWSFTFNADQNSFDLVLAGYVSEQERQEGKRPLPQGMRHFHWQGDDNPVTPSVLQAGGAFAAVYAKVKEPIPSALNAPGQEPYETNPFVDAVDV